MCTVIVLRRDGSDWPLLLAGNRDEMADRPWQPPARHWPLSPDVVGGLDEIGQGSWLGLNDHGVVATVLNRIGTLGPETGKRSRGELVLQALDHADADSAALALGAIDPAAYRSFNLVIADNRDGFWLRSDGRRLSRQPLPEGLSMLTAGDLNDPGDPRIAAYRARFAANPPPDPATDDWGAWPALLGERAPAPALSDEQAPVPAPGAEVGLTFQLDSGFGTRSAALIALPSMQCAVLRPRFLFAAGPPDRSGFSPLLL